MKFGRLTAPFAKIVASGGSGVSGMTVQSLEIDSSGGSSIDTTAAGTIRGSCSGGGHVAIEGGSPTSDIFVSGGRLVANKRRRLRFV